MSSSWRGLIWIQRSKRNTQRQSDEGGWWQQTSPSLSPFSPLYSVHGRSVAGRVPQFRHRFCINLLALSHYHYWLLRLTPHWWRFFGEASKFQLVLEQISLNRHRYRVSQNIGPTLFLSFSRVLEPVQRNFWPLINSPGNLLHDSHKNFENWFRNSWDNWHQSWHPSFRNWHFAISQSQKNNFGVTGANFDLNYLSYF